MILFPEAEVEFITSNPGRMLASNCFQCHGTNMCGLENLAGEPSAHLIDEMIELGMNDPRDEIMNVHALGYTMAEITLMAEYISSLQCIESTPQDLAGVNRLIEDHTESRRYMAPLIIESEALIHADIMIEYESGDNIELLPGFELSSGSLLELQIHNCINH